MVGFRLTVGLHHFILNNDEKGIFDGTGFGVLQCIFNIVASIAHAPFQFGNGHLMDLVLSRKRLSGREFPRVNRFGRVDSSCNEFLWRWL